MGGLLRLIPVAIVLGCSVTAAAAWTPETRVRLVDEAVRLMPTSLRLVLEKRAVEIRRGMLGPMASEDDPSHRAPWLEGTLDEALAAEVRELVGALEQQTPFNELAMRFGRIAHYVADSGFPPGMTADGDSRYQHFAGFCESRRERFPLVFYGHDDTALSDGDYRAYALGVMHRARDNDRELARAYASAGDPPDPDSFDDRSVPFAVGSLSYSQTFTDIVRVWLAAWEQAGGDMGRTPYRKSR